MRALRVAAVVLLAAQLARAEEIPVEKRVLILLRVLAYDHQLARRAGDSVPVAVVYRAGDAASEAAATEMVTALGAAAAKVNVAERPVRVASLPFGDGLDRDLARARAVAVYVCPGLEKETARIAAATAKGQALSFSHDEAGVHAGLSVGIVRRGDRAAIVVNLVAARAEGAELSAALLRLAEVVKR